MTHNPTLHRTLEPHASLVTLKLRTDLAPLLRRWLDSEIEPTQEPNYVLCRRDALLAQDERPRVAEGPIKPHEGVCSVCMVAVIRALDEICSIHRKVHITCAPAFNFKHRVDDRARLC